MIDPDFAADRAVDLGEQGRRHHDQGQAPRVGCGHKAGEVTDHAPPEGNDQRVAIGLPSAPARRKAATPDRATCSPHPRERPRARLRSRPRPGPPGMRPERLGGLAWFRDGEPQRHPARTEPRPPEAVRPPDRCRIIEIGEVRVSDHDAHFDTIFPTKCGQAPRERTRQNHRPARSPRELRRNKGPARP